MHKTRHGRNHGRRRIHAWTTPSVNGLKAAAVWQRAIFERLSGKAEESFKIRIASLRLKVAKLPPMSDKNMGVHVAIAQ